MCAASIDSSRWSMMTDIFAAENDKTKDLIHDVIPEIMKCMQDYGLTFQDIELGLRENHCVTHLIARNWNPSSDQRTVEYPKGTFKLYSIYFSIAKGNELNKEILRESRSYDENFRKLAHAGIVTAKRQPTDSYHSWHQLMSGAATMDRGEFIQELQKYKVPGKKNAIKDVMSA